jgi:hypothetical protein
MASILRTLCPETKVIYFYLRLESGQDSSAAAT